MGIRGELFSTRVTCEGRTYFFNVKQNRMGDVFLSIVESKPTEMENFDRRSIVVFGSDVKPFIKAFQTALSFMEKPQDKIQGHPLSFKPAAPIPSRKASLEAHAAEEALRAEAAKVPKRRVVVKRAKPGAEPVADGESPTGDTIDPADISNATQADSTPKTGKN